jgi:phosphoglycerol geranylgeranyltransferase
MTHHIYDNWLHSRKTNKKLLGILIDPDKVNEQKLQPLVDQLIRFPPDYVFVGGSLMTVDRLNQTLAYLKKKLSIPIVLFPGSYWHISPLADGILFLSLISGRNPDYLIGNQVIAAPILRQTQLEIIPTAYMLVHGGTMTSVAYISNTFPIPHDKDDIAACTALAGEMLGLKVVYLDAGSGAQQAVSASMIAAVRKQTEVPLIVGGGIRKAEQMERAYRAGADLLIIGTAIEENSHLLQQFWEVKNSFSPV